MPLYRIDFCCCFYLRFELLKGVSTNGPEISGVAHCPMGQVRRVELGLVEISNAELELIILYSGTAW